ncbi:hypothetical protein Hanom_Chr11g01034241 [Helianthus anomalus]
MAINKVYLYMILPACTSQKNLFYNSLMHKNTQNTRGARLTLKYPPKNEPSSASCFTRASGVLFKSKFVSTKVSLKEARRCFVHI